MIAPNCLREDPMKIKITTDIGVWIDSVPRPIGYVCTLDDDVAKAIIANGHAEQVKVGRRPKNEG